MAWIGEAAEGEGGTGAGSCSELDGTTRDGELPSRNLLFPAGKSSRFLDSASLSATDKLAALEMTKLEMRTECAKYIDAVIPSRGSPSRLGMANCRRGTCFSLPANPAGFSTPQACP